MKNVLSEIAKCTLCSEHLELGPNPVVRAHTNSRIVVIGQAPGTKVHKTGIPWNDPSGVQLRKWMALDEQSFYNTENIAIIPMGFCYPGKGKTGDLPPRPECAPLWHEKLFDLMPNVELVLLIGQYAQKYYLGNAFGKNLTETVRNYKAYLPKFFPMPHPSPRNRIWVKKNEWFEEEVVLELRARVGELVGASLR